MSVKDSIMYNKQDIRAKKKLTQIKDENEDSIT